MIEAAQHADEELKYFRSRFEDRLTEEDYRIIRLELLTAYRKGYQLACQNDFEMKMGYIEKRRKSKKARDRIFRKKR